MDHEQQPESNIQIGDLTLDVGTHQVFRGKQEIPLPQLSYQLLRTLAEAAPNLVTHDELAQQVWTDRVVTPETMTQRVKLLRQSLGDDAQNPRYIGLVRGEGYRILADVSRGEPGSRQRRWAISAVLLAAACAAAVLAAQSFFAANPSYESIAVMQFINASDQSEDVYISQGLGDELRDQLGRIGGLRVAARSSSVAIRDSEANAKAAARALGVDLLIEGSMRRDDANLRIMVQIIDGQTGFQIWSQSYDRLANDLLAIQREIAIDVTQHLLPSLDSAIATRAMQTQIVSANEFLLLARHYELQVRDHHLVDIPTLSKAIDLYSEAIALDPNSAIAHSRLGGALLQLGDARNAREPIFTALSLNPDLSEVQYNLGLYYWLTEQAGIGAAYERAISLDPYNADALAAYGNWIWHQEQVLAAEYYFQEALENDPLSLTRFSDLGTYYGIVGRKAEALNIAGRIERRFDTTASLLVLARIHEITGQFEEAIGFALQAHQREPDSADPRGMVAELYARIGDHESARQYEPDPGIGQLYWQRRYDELIELAEELIIDYPNEIQIWYSLARAYNSTGQFENTVRLLERAGLPQRVYSESVRANGKEALATLADAYAHSGDEASKEEVANWLDEHMRMNAEAGAARAWWPNLYRACALSILGQDDAAMDSLLRIIDSPGLVWYPLLVDSPCLNRFAEDHRYIAVVNHVEERMIRLRQQVQDST